MGGGIINPASAGKVCFFNRGVRKTEAIFPSGTEHDVLRQDRKNKGRRAGVPAAVMGGQQYGAF